MTRFTPERLARTDFLRLIPTSPEDARGRLEALVSDPEALALYADSLLAQGDLGHRPAPPTDWDTLRRRILAEGLRGAGIDEETLTWLALDFDALAELQFDLYSVDALPQVWRRVMEEGLAERAGMEAAEGGQAGHLPMRDACCGVTPCDLASIPGGRGEAGPGPEGECRAVSDPRRTPTPLPGPTFVDTPGVIGPEDTWWCRLNFQRCVADRRGWLHWSNHTVEDATVGARIVLFVHHESMADPALPQGDLDWAWATVSASSSVCLHVQGPARAPRREPRVLLSARPYDTARIAWGRSLLGWIQARMTFFRPWNATFKGATSRPPIEGFALIDDLLSKLELPWDDSLAPLVIVVDARSEVPLVEPGRAAGGAGDWRDYRAANSPDDSRLASGRILHRQLPPPRAAKCPHRV